MIPCGAGFSRRNAIAHHSAQTARVTLTPNIWENPFALWSPQELRRLREATSDALRAKAEAEAEAAAAAARLRFEQENSALLALARLYHVIGGCEESCWEPSSFSQTRAMARRRGAAAWRDGGRAPSRAVGCPGAATRAFLAAPVTVRSDSSSFRRAFPPSALRGSMRGQKCPAVRLEMRGRAACRFSRNCPVPLRPLRSCHDASGLADTQAALADLRQKRARQDRALSLQRARARALLAQRARLGLLLLAAGEEARRLGAAAGELRSLVRAEGQPNSLLRAQACPHSGPSSDRGDATW